MAETAKKEIEQIKIDPLKPSALEFGIHAYQQFSCRVPNGITAEQLLDPDFWVFGVPKIQMGAEIRVIPEDFSYRAQLLVIFTDRSNIRLKLINYVELENVNVVPSGPNAKQYSITMRGQQKWCVQRMSDGEFIKELVPTKQEAITWLDKYVAALDGDAKAEKWLLDQDK